MMTIAQHPVMDVQTTAVLEMDEIRIKTPGNVLPIELIDWLRTYPGVVQVSVAEADKLGQTDYVLLTWTNEEINLFASVMIEMITTYFGWDRQAVHFTGDWTDDNDELAYAAHRLATAVPPLQERVLHLQPGMIYVIDGTLEVGSMPDGRTAFRLV